MTFSWFRSINQVRSIQSFKQSFSSFKTEISSMESIANISEGSDKVNDLKCKGNVSSKQLLYSEYMSSDMISEVLNPAKKTQPLFQFTKSSVLSRAIDFLPKLEEAQKDLQLKLPEEYNIESVKENEPVIEMNLSVFEDLTGNIEISSSEESDLEEESESDSNENKITLIQEISEDSN